MKKVVSINYTFENSSKMIISFLRKLSHPLTLLVGMQTSTATLENSVEIPYKTANRTAL